MASDYLRRDRPWESPKRSRSGSREHEVHAAHSLHHHAAPAPRSHHQQTHPAPPAADEVLRLRRHNDVLEGKVDDCIRRIASISMAAQQPHHHHPRAASAGSGIPSEADQQLYAFAQRQKEVRASSSPTPPPLPPPALVLLRDANAERIASDDECRYLRGCLGEAEKRGAELQSAQEDNARLRSEVDRLRRAVEACRSRPAAEADVLRMLPEDDGASAEVLIGSIKSAFLQADRRNGLATTIADRLKKTEKKIALLTEENSRLQGKLERSQQRGDDLKSEVKRLRRELRDGSSAEEVGGGGVGGGDVASLAAVSASREAQALLALKSEEVDRLKEEVRVLQEARRSGVGGGGSGGGGGEQHFEVEVRRLRNALEVAEARCHTLESAHAASQRELRTAQKDASAAASSLTSTQAELRILQARSDDVARDNAKLQAQHQAVQQEHTVVEREFRELKISNTTQLRSREDEVLKATASLASKDLEIADLRAKVDRLQEGSRSATTASADVEQSYRQKVQQLEVEREGHFSRNRDLERINSELQRLNADLETRVEQARKSLVDASQSHEAQLRQREAQAEREVGDLRRSISNMGVEAARRRDDTDTSQQARLAALQQDLQAAAADILSLKEANSKLEMQVGAARDASERDRVEHATVLAGKSREVDLLHMSKQQEVAVLTSRLEQEKQKYQDLMSMTESKHTFVIDENNSLKLDKARLLEQARSLTEGGAASREELRAAVQLSTEKDASLSQEKARRVEAEANCKHAREQLEEARHLLAKKEAEVRELLKGLQQQTDTASQAGHKRNEIESQLRDMELKRQKERTHSELVERQRYNELSELKARNAKYDEQLQVAQRGLADMEAMYNEQKSTVQDMLQERQEEHRTVLEPLREKAANQRGELHKLRDKEALLEKQVDTQRTRADQAQTELAEANIKRSELQAAVNDLQRALQDAEEGRREAQGKLTERSTRAYDDQLSLSAQLQSLERECSLLRARLSDADGENRRLASDLDDAHHDAQKHKQTLADNKALLDRLPFLELKLQEVNQQKDVLRQQVETYAESQAALAADADMKEQALRDKGQEVRELRHSLDVLKATCDQHEREASSRLSEPRSAAVEAAAVPLEAPAAASSGAESLAAEHAALQAQVASLESSLAAERARCEEVATEARAKARESDADAESSRKEAVAAKASLAGAVALQGMLLSKLRDFAQDAASAAGVPTDAQLHASVAPVTESWRAEPASWDPSLAQDLFTRLLSALMRCLETLKVKSGGSRPPP